MASSPAQLAAKLQKVSKNLEKVPRNAVFKASLAGKAVMVAEAAAKGLSPTSRIARARWSVGFDVKGTRNPTSILRYRGQVHLVNNPTRPHDIVPRERARGRRKRALATAHGPFGRVRHPGTKGKRFFESSRPKVEKVASEAFEREMRSALYTSMKR